MQRIVSIYALVAAAAIGGTEAWLAHDAGRDAQDVMLYALVGAAATAWLIAILRLLWSHWPLASSNQVRALAAATPVQDRFNRLAWSRMQGLDSAIALLAVEQQLPAIEGRLAHAEAALDALEQPAATLPLWREAASAWLAAVAPVIPDIAHEFVAPTPLALRQARQTLPPGRNLASADLRAAALFLIEREQFAAARTRYAAHRTAVLSRDDAA